MLGNAANPTVDAEANVSDSLSPCFTQ